MLERMQEWQYDFLKLIPALIIPSFCQTLILWRLDKHHANFGWLIQNFKSSGLKRDK